MVSSKEFENALIEIFQDAQKDGLSSVNVTSGELHRKLGGYPSSNHNMPGCCSVMSRIMESDDEVLDEPLKGKGATLTIKYSLPRSSINTKNSNGFMNWNSLKQNKKNKSILKSTTKNISSKKNKSMKRIFITHCSAKKDDSFKITNEDVSPDELYTATPTNRFMEKCKEQEVDWAIFSDEYGVWFPNITHKWYEKDPNIVSEKEFNNLINNFEQSLSDYDEVWFYYNPGRFHPLYDRLLRETKLNNKITRFTHISDIS